MRAQEILGNLERTEFDREGRPRLAHSDSAPAPAARQLALFSGQDEAVLDDLRRADPDQLTPIQALALLAELKNGCPSSGSSRGVWGVPHPQSKERWLMVDDFFTPRSRGLVLIRERLPL